MKIGVKPYPSCRYTHAALDGMVIPMDDEFHVGSDTMLYPGGGSDAAGPTGRRTHRSTLAHTA